MDGNGLAAAINGHLRAGGADLVGIADLSPVPSLDRFDLPRGIVFAARIDSAVLAGITERPTEEYVREYHRLNALLSDLASSCAALIGECRFRAVPRPATMEELPEDLTTPLPHKTIATLAGLGWIGKCALLVTRELGPAVRLASLLTDAPLPAGTPVTGSNCGKCDTCVRECPGKAPKGPDWKQGMPREEFFDAFACARTCGAVAKEAGISAGICGRCIAVCPVSGLGAKPAR